MHVCVQPERQPVTRAAHRMRNEFALGSRTGVRGSFMALTFASGSRAVPHSTAHDDVHGAVHGAFMTLPPYTRIREGEVHELGLGVSNCSHRARSRPLSETSESVERVCEATSAEGTARCASRGSSKKRKESLSWLSLQQPGACGRGEVSLPITMSETLSLIRLCRSSQPGQEARRLTKSAREVGGR